MIQLRKFLNTVASQRVLRLMVGVLGVPLLFLTAIFPWKVGRTLVWAPTPLINIKYWSAAMRAAGWESLTLVDNCYHISKTSDFDVYFAQLVPRFLKPVAKLIEPYVAMAFVLRRARVLHIAFSGGPLYNTPFWGVESLLLRLRKIKVVVLPYGGDVAMYSRLTSTVVRNAFLASFPAGGRFEANIRRRVEYWCRNADLIVMGFNTDGVPRWDIPVGNMLCIDLSSWEPKQTRSEADGIDGTVRVLHAPNWRGVKGTEFIIDAVEQLRSEGLQIELVLAEKRTNEEIKGLMQEADIFFDQLIIPGYGLAAIEAMASGLPVLCNLDADPDQSRLFRLYSFLDEAPFVSTKPETAYAELRELVTNPELRLKLGDAGRGYVERFHSYPAAQFLFSSIYAVLLDGEDIDLRRLYQRESHKRFETRLDSLSPSL